MTYRDLSKGLPRVGDKINTPEGRGKVRDVNIIKRVAVVEFPEGKVIKMVFPKKEEDSSNTGGGVLNSNEFAEDEDIPHDAEGSI